MRANLVVVLVAVLYVLPMSSHAGQKKDAVSAKSSTSTTRSCGTSASAIAICGIKPPPPVGFRSDDAVCLCDGKKCTWVWMKR